MARTRRFQSAGLTCAALAGWLMLGIHNAPAQSTPLTALKQTPTGYELLVDGKPFQIKGVGGEGPKQAAQAAGANAFRTWGTDDIDAQLAVARASNMKIVVGIWMEHERHGFSYTNPKDVAAMIERARAVITKHKDNPDILMWAIGNEMEGDLGRNPAIWLAVNHIAAMAKKIDPTRPTMTVIAELGVGGEKVKLLHQFCPDIDIVGLNSYAGAVSVPERYKQSGATKPYIITEFGPPGTWEIQKTPYGAVVEPTSTAKAASYKSAYQSFMADPMCLGSFAFKWGSKQEATSTWFGMQLPDGSNVEAAHVMQELWSGKAPANRCPAIASMSVAPSSNFAPGAIVEATLDVNDADGDALSTTWELHTEAAVYGLGGDAEPKTPIHSKAIVSSSTQSATIQLPIEPGVYRLYAVVRDGKNNAATATTTFLIPGEKSAAKVATIPPGKSSKLPVFVYRDSGQPVPWVPSGWMGNTGAIRMDEKYPVEPKTGTTCLKFEFLASTGFGGVVWQDPANDWGDQPGGVDLRGATSLKFWAKGATGGEVIEFKLGVLGSEKTHPDSGSAAATFTLTNTWKEYTIDVANLDLSRIKTGFCWVLQGQGKPVTFFLDDMRYE
jgi:Glycosyl hydrolases family 2, TIM barrel domain